MAAVTTQTLRMAFRTEGGSNFIITLDNPKDNLTPEQITGAMDTIIAKNVFLTPGGHLASKQDARIIDRTMNDVYNS